MLHESLQAFVSVRFDTQLCGSLSLAIKGLSHLYFLRSWPTLEFKNPFISAIASRDGEATEYVFESEKCARSSVDSLDERQTEEKRNHGTIKITCTIKKTKQALVISVVWDKFTFKILKPFLLKG